MIDVGDTINKVGYVLQDLSLITVKTSGCFECHSSCATCDGPGYDKCLSCHPWATFNPSTKTCEAINCHSECDTCNLWGRTDCLSCTGALNLSTNRECCDPECLTCSGTFNTNCNSCYPGAHLFTNYCSCDPACFTCNGATSSNCLICAAGYKPNHLNSANCLLCHNSCKTCFTPNNKYDCGSCETPL